MSDIKFDALTTGQTKIINHKIDYCEILNQNILQLIEKDLGDDEKISVLFLTINNYNYYNEIIEIYLSERRSNLISEFLSRNSINDWQERIVESFFIIQNYFVLKKLGLSTDLKVNFVPYLGFKTVKINLSGKILYRIFDSLEQDDVDNLFSFVYKQIPMDRRLKFDDPLELHALYWFHQISNNQSLQMILKFMKQINKYDTPEYQDMEKFCSENLSKIQNEKVFIRKGLCLIINEIHFPNTDFEDRDSSKVDAVNLEKTFRGLNYEVKTFTDASEREIIEILSSYSEKFEPQVYDCFLICILSHGYPGGFISTDGKYIPIDIIEDKMCSKYWRNILKMLIVQACQGENQGLACASGESAKSSLITDGLTTNSVKKQRVTDDYTEFFLFMSTMNQYASIRHRTNGSWFIEDICDVMQSRKVGDKKISISKLSHEVKNKVQCRRGLIDHKLISQLPETTERLTKKFYFPVYNYEGNLN